MKTRSRQCWLEDFLSNPEKLHQESNENKATINCLQSDIKKLKESFGKQKQELDSKISVQTALETRLEASQKKLDECRLQIEDIQQVHAEQMRDLKVSQKKEKDQWVITTELLQKQINEKDQYISQQEKLIEFVNEKVTHLELLFFAKEKHDTTVAITQGCTHSQEINL